jgi:hypothetical protein
MPINTSRFKAIWPWLGEERYTWLSVAVICVAMLLSLLIISLRPHWTEPVIRFTGLLFQLLGISTVIWGISETRALFGHPSFLSRKKAWLSRFPLLRRDVVLAGEGVTHVLVSDEATVYMTHGAGPNPTIEARLDALEKNVTSIHERITQTQKEIDKEFHTITGAIKREEQSRQAEDNAIRVKLEATGTGGVHISAIGASWLFMGIILSTAATEIAALLK